ncbi:MAG: ROK family protein [Verrucomicrobiota bacterium]
MSDCFAGIDRGGTIIKAAVFGGGGERLAERQDSTGDGEWEGGVAVWKARVRELLCGLEAECGRVAAVGVSSPGLVAGDERSVLSMPGRMDGLEGWEWSGWLGRGEGVPVVNDAQAALLGEVWCGAARGCRDAVMFTLGTGVGGAIWSGGRLLRGHLGRAGHFGHLCLDLDGEPTIAGMPGGLENFVGNFSVRERSGGRWESTRALVAAVAAGDAVARQVWERSVRALACGVATVINIVDPERVVIGGGIAVAGEQLFPLLERELAAVEWRPAGMAVPVVAAELGEGAGAAGAAWRAAQWIGACGSGVEA